MQIFIFPTPSQVKANGGEGGQVLANEAAGPAFTVLAPSPDRRAEVMTQIEELDVRAALQRSTPVAGTHVFICVLQLTLYMPAKEGGGRRLFVAVLARQVGDNSTPAWNARTSRFSSLPSMLHSSTSRDLTRWRICGRCEGSVSGGGARGKVALFRKTNGGQTSQRRREAGTGRHQASCLPPL